MQTVSSSTWQLRSGKSLNRSSTFANSLNAYTPYLLSPFHNPLRFSRITCILLLLASYLFGFCSLKSSAKSPAISFSSMFCASRSSSLNGTAKLTANTKPATVNERSVLILDNSFQLMKCSKLCLFLTNRGEKYWTGLFFFSKP